MEQKSTDDRRMLVYRTAQFSACAQIFLGFFSLIGFIKVPDEKTAVLTTLLILDTVVQLIELTFYVVFICYKQLDTYYRYFDWYLSTPIMLVSTMMFLQYLADHGTSVSSFASEFRNDIIFVILMNSFMLSFGFCAELGWIKPRVVALVLGWVPFLLVFAAIYARNAYRTAGGVCLLTFVFVVWALYGVAAFFDDVRKNVAYNILDIVSKNFYGVVVSVFLIAE